MWSCWRGREGKTVCLFQISTVNSQSDSARAEGLIDMTSGIALSLFQAWDREIARSQSHWQIITGHEFGYNARAPSIAYDPASIPESPLGPFVHLKYQPPSEANNLAVTRDEIASGRDKGSLAHEFANELIEHPGRGDLIIIPNRWPRVKYHSLIVTRSLLPQKLTADLAQVELYWAGLGFVVEFHRFDRILNHFHFHIYPSDRAPIHRARDSFETFRSFETFETGMLRAYPAPHIAIRSRVRDWLPDAMERVSSHLDDLKTPYGQITMSTSSGEMVLLIFLRGPYRIEGLSFSLIGLVRTRKDISEDEAVKFSKNIHWTTDELNDLSENLSEILK